MMVRWLTAAGAAILFATSCGNGSPREGGATDETQTASADLVEKGKYLAAAGDCVSCHTGDDGVAFAGGHEFHTPFGLIYSTNITPDPDVGIGAWSLEDFRRAMRDGVDRRGRHLYPVFPYTNFTLARDEDIDALYAYLRTLPPQSYEPPKNRMNFPFGWRTLLGGWKAMNFKSKPFEPDASQSSEWNRGAYLVEGLAHCGACHTPRGALGGEKKDLAYSGATYLDRIESEDIIRPWTAVNLTPASTGLGAWSEDDIVSYLKTGHSPRAGSFGPMNKVISNGTQQLSDADVRAMAIYLKSLPPIGDREPPILSEEAAREGERLYTIHCGTCHLPTGAGDPTMGPPLAGSAVTQADDAASLINVILYGAEIPRPAPVGAWKNMEAFGDKLDDDEVALLASYVRASWGNAAGEVTVKQVEKQR